MVQLGDVGGFAKGALLSWGFWLMLAVALIAVIFGSLYMRKRGKFIYPAVIFTDNGNGKVGVKYTRAGWFKSKKLLGGLIDYAGEKRFEVKDGRMIQQGSTSDFHELNFKAGLLLMEKEDDPKILVPLSKCDLSESSKKMIFQIAPADYRDACSKIVADAEKESLSKWETLAQVIVFGFIGVILFISIILTIQYAKNAMTEANAVHKDALAFYEKVIQRGSTTPSTAP